MARRWRRVSLRRRLDATQVACDGESLSVRIVKQDGTDDRRSRVSWSDVTRVTAFKRDLHGFDQINLQFEGPGDASVCVNEDMEGWRQLLGELPAVLPGAHEVGAWWRGVAYPAFERCETVIYKKDGHA